jgi:arylsulfatase A-like enzyme
VSLALFSALAASAAEPRSFIVIVADDVGTDKVGVYGESPKAPPTPNIDALGASGVWFRNAYVSPVCSSSRALLLTGRYGRRTGLGGIIEGGGDYELPLSEVTLPEALDRGPGDWSSGAFGKWHLSGLNTPNAYRHPQLQGFDRARGSLSNVANNQLVPGATYSRWEKNVDGRPEVSTTYATTDTTDEAITALQELRAPYFLWVAYNAAHEPFHWPPATTSEKGRGPAAQHDALVTSLDREVGRLLRALTDEQRATTTIVFISDNGTPGDAVRAPFDPDHAKGTLYEGGTNVPLIVAGAGVTGRGESDALVHGVDLLPTVLDLAGVSADGLVLDGVSFAPLLANPRGPSVRQFVFTERFRPNGPPAERVRVDEVAIRDERYKLVRFEENGRWVRFDLKGRSDDGEPLKKSVAEARFAALEAELERTLAELAAGDRPADR